MSKVPFASRYLSAYLAKVRTRRSKIRRAVSRRTAAVCHSLAHVFGDRARNARGGIRRSRNASHAGKYIITHSRATPFARSPGYKSANALCVPPVIPFAPLAAFRRHFACPPPRYSLSLFHLDLFFPRFEETFTLKRPRRNFRYIGGYSRHVLLIIVDACTRRGLGTERRKMARSGEK